MKDIEYTQMATLYDEFYKNKNYTKEVDFIKNFIEDKSIKILDVGCGSGTHAKILSDCGYDVKGFDKSPDMVSIANSKVPEHFFVDDLLNIKHDQKYDLIVSFFAVFNHLQGYKEFIVALNNLKHLLKDKGKIIVDLHNPQKNGSKTERIENAVRIMKWHKCNLLKKEFSKITYIVNNKTFKTTHVFKIYSLEKLRKIAKNSGFAYVQFCENYNVDSVAKNSSKNIQMILEI